MKKVVFAFVIFLAIFFRFYNLAIVPPHPSLDEVSIGYNAYSILETGKDEFLTPFPILLRAYDDWRPAVYVYLVIPFVKLLGLNVFAVRLPSAILSLLSVVSVYFLVKYLLSKTSSEVSFYLPLISMFLVAVSPWHVYLSRLGHEVNAFLAFFIFGLMFFFKFVTNSKDKPFLSLPLSLFFFGLSFDSYQSGKIFIPLICLSLFILFPRNLLSNKKALILSFVIGFIVVLPIIIETFKPHGLARFQATNILSSNPKVLEISAKRSLEAKEKGDFLSLVINNRRVAYGSLIAGAYLSHLNPAWLVKNGGDEPFKVPNFGLLYSFEAFFILFGICFLLKKDDFNGKIKIFFLLWFLFSIIPGAITNGYPHAMRIYQIVPLPQILAGYGLLRLLLFVKKSVLFKLLPLLGLVMLFFVASFAKSYFSEFKINTAHQFQYGLMQAIEASGNIDEDYNKVFLSNKDNLFQSYMFYLFQTKFDPKTYQKMGGTKSGGFAQDHHIGKYYFKDLSTFEKNNLYILNPDEFNSSNLSIVEKIDFPNGKTSIIMGEVSSPLLRP